MKGGLIACVYVPLWSSNPNLNAESPEYIRGMDMENKMVLNFTIDAVLILLPIVVGVVILILSATLLLNMKRKLAIWK